MSQHSFSRVSRKENSNDKTKILYDKQEKHQKQESYTLKKEKKCDKTSKKTNTRKT